MPALRRVREGVAGGFGFVRARTVHTATAHLRRLRPQSHVEGHRILHTWGSPPVDDYFVLPLWIQTPCCGHVLWAYNWQHLELIAGFVEAEHRKRRRDVDRRWSNRALSSRLPRWIKIASNRQAVLACIRKLQHERR